MADTDAATPTFKQVAYSLLDPRIAVAGLALETDPTTQFEVHDGNLSAAGNPPGDSAGVFFAGRWQTRCFKTMPYAGSVLIDARARRKWMDGHPRGSPRSRLPR
jgi:hypothetical protein